MYPGGLGYAVRPPLAACCWQGLRSEYSMRNYYSRITEGACIMPVLEKFSLKGKKVLVTGGVAKYGQSISEGVAEAGATTIIASRSEEKRQAVIDGLTKSGYEAHSYYLDLGKEETIAQLHKDITERFGALDVLINAAVLRPCKGYNCSLAIAGLFPLIWVAAETTGTSTPSKNSLSLRGLLGTRAPYLRPQHRKHDPARQARPLHSAGRL